MGGPDIVFLFKCIRKVQADATYNAAVTTIRTAITSKTNQAMLRFKLYTAIPQGTQPFASWWTKVKEQADKCVFTDYN